MFADTLVVHMLIFGTQKSPQGPEKTTPHHHQHMALEASRWQETARVPDLCSQFTSLGSLEGLHVPGSVSLGKRQVRAADTPALRTSLSVITHLEKGQRLPP